MKRWNRWFIWPLTLVAVLCTFQKNYAQPNAVKPSTPAAEALLPRCLPKGTAFCVILRDLNGFVDDPSTDDFIQNLTKVPFLADLLQNSDLEKADEILHAVLHSADLTKKTFIREVLGEFVIIGFRPGPPERPDQESAILVIQPKQLTSLERLVGVLNQIQRVSGELVEIKRLETHGVTYFARHMNNGETNFYAFHNGSFYFTTQETTLVAIFDERQPKLELQEQINELNFQQARFVFLIQPQVFQAEFEKGAQTSPSDSDRAFLTQFSKVWAGLSVVGIALKPGTMTNLILKLSWQNPARLNAVAYRSRQSSNAHVSYVSGAMIGFAAQVELKPLLDFILPFLPEQGRAELTTLQQEVLAPVVGKENWPTLLARVGPGFIARVEPPIRAGQVLPSWLFAWQLGVKPSDTEANTLKIAVYDLAEFLFQQFRFGYNRTHEDQVRILRTSFDDRSTAIDVLTLTNSKGFAEGWQPSFAVREGFAIFASHPEDLRRFRAKPTAAVEPTLRWHGEALRTYLAQQGEELLATVSRATDQPLEAIREQMKPIFLLCNLFDEITVDLTSSEQQIGLELRFRLSLTPKK